MSNTAVLDENGIATVAPPPHRQQAGYSATELRSPKNNILFWSESTRPSVFPICAVSLSVDGTVVARLIPGVRYFHFRKGLSSITILRWISRT